ncbi:MAG: NifU family protein [Alphaproteobacteria bacterium]|nr:NifU family protein [Alphaproteobacteria bacterium]
MIIEFEKTSDDNVCNFYPENNMFEGDALDCFDTKTIKKSPLAEALFDIKGIERVLISKDMISVKKNKDALWEDLKPQIISEILDFIVTGAPMVLVEKTENDDDILQKVISLIDARIRPLLHRDGGDIEIKNFENGVLEVELTGRCAACPYAMRTLKDGVEKILKAYIVQIKEVKPYQNE